MKLTTLNETFTEEEYNLLTTAKGEQTWREFILTLVTSKKDQEPPTEHNMKTHRVIDDE